MKLSCLLLVALAAGTLGARRRSPRPQAEQPDDNPDYNENEYDYNYGGGDSEDGQ